MDLKLTKPQLQFIQSQATYRLFCAGYGSGKSECMAVAAIMDLYEGADVVVGLYAPTYTDIKGITLPRITNKLVDFGIRFRINKQDKIIYTTTPGVGDFIYRSMDNPETIVGFEQYSGHIDEIDTMRQNKAEEAWKKILGRTRQKLSNGKENNRLSAYTTPEGFRFAYKRWVIQHQPGYEIIQASSFSNPFLPKAYIQNLRDTYTDEVYKAYVMGEFTNLTSGTIYDSYDRTLHYTNVTEPNPKERIYIGQDFNVDNMASVLAVHRGGKFHVFGEMIGIQDTPHLIEAINTKYRSNPIFIYPDSSGRSRKTVDASRSDISLLSHAGYEVRTKGKVNPSVRNRILAMNLGFAHGKILVNYKNAPTVARNLEQQVYGPNGEPDKDGNNDHTNDAFGYMINYEMPVHRPKFDTSKVKFG